jgi:hypothetical protein
VNQRNNDKQIRDDIVQMLIVIHNAFDCLTHNLILFNIVNSNIATASDVYIFSTDDNMNKMYRY